MWAVLGQLLMLAYLPGCTYLGAVRGTVGVAWAVMVPWGLVYFDLAGGDGVGDHTVALVPFGISLLGLVVCLVAQLLWRRRTGA